jgi:thiamine biosynthesis lipoprotein
LYRSSFDHCIEPLRPITEVREPAHSPESPLQARRALADHADAVQLHPAVRALLLGATVLALASCARPRALQTFTGLAQGTTYTLQWWSEDRVDTRALTTAVTAELERLDALLSNYRADSALERFNATRSTEPQQLPAELVSLFELAVDIHRRSAGCFDPSVRPLVRLWGFDGDDPHVPGDDEIVSTLARVGLDKLEIVDKEHVRKARADLEIDMASIGQGYTVGRISDVAAGFGLRNYLFEIGGELAGRGTRPDGKSWRVGIENPDKEDAPIRALNLPSDRVTAVITSGSYRHNFTDHDRVYGHILDPRTGRSVDHDLVSVTVTGAVAARTAAWGTALLCLGPTPAFETAEREQVAAVFILKTPAGFEVRQSSAFNAAWGQAAPP